MEYPINISNISGGALVEQVDYEIQKVLENIQDPNTDAGKTRKITITLSFKPSGTRTTADISFQTKASLVSAKAVSTTVMMEKGKSGQTIAIEIGNEVPGQTNVVNMVK